MIKEYVRKFEKNSIVTSILMIVLALFLIIEPIKTLKTVILIFGIVITVLGFISLVSYFRLEKDYKLVSFGLIEGLLEIIAGILIIFNAQSLTSFLPVLVGIWIIVKNLIRCQLAINLSTIKGSSWGLLLVVGAYY